MSLKNLKGNKMKLDKDLKKMLRNILKEMTTESDRRCEEYWNDTEAPLELTRGDLRFIFDCLDSHDDKIADLEDRIKKLQAAEFWGNFMSKKTNDIENKEKIINRFFSKSEKSKRK